MTIDEQNIALSEVLDSIRPRVQEILGQSAGMGLFAWDGKTVFVSHSDNVTGPELMAVTMGMQPLLAEG